MTSETPVQSRAERTGPALYKMPTKAKKIDNPSADFDIIS